MNPEAFRKLVAAGLSSEQLAVVMDIMAEREAEIAAAENTRKQQARERVQKWRDKQKADDVTLQKCNGNATLRLTRAEDSSSTSEISGKGKEESVSPAARPTRGTRVPADFIPDLDAAMAAGLTRAEAEREIPKFLDYWRSVPGQRGIKLDWPATWRNWCRRAAEQRPPARSGAPPGQQESTSDMIDRMLNPRQSDAPFAGPTFDASFDRTDRGSAQNLVRLHAAGARR